MKKTFTDSQFCEWLVGFLDAEGSFDIREIKNRPFAFEFRLRIGLHHDDRKLLIYILNHLGMGTLSSLNTKNAATVSTWSVSKKEDVLNLINILDKYGPLNTTKYLDYINWKTAFMLYINNNNESITKKEKIKSDILTFKKGMNKNRTDIVMPSTHSMVIKPYWLIGFIEGEGCFSVSKPIKDKSLTISFILVQTAVQKPLMEAIQTFLNNLQPNSLDCSTPQATNIKMSEITNLNNNSKPIIRLYCTDFLFLTDYLIPFLDKFVFLSKKELDYLDWKTAVKIKSEKKHLSDEGSNIIKLICSRMNVNRRSNYTNNLNHSVDNNNLDAKISDLLQAPKKGIWVYSEGKLIEGSPFQNINSVAKFLGVTRSGSTAKLIDTGKLFHKKYTLYSKPITFPL